MILTRTDTPEGLCFIRWYIGVLDYVDLQYSFEQGSGWFCFDLVAKTNIRKAKLNRGPT